MALTAAERQRRCREKRKNNPVKEEEFREKDLLRYHARKKLVKNMSAREHRLAKRKWQLANKKRRDKQKALRNAMLNTPPSSPQSLTPRDQSPRPVSPVPSPASIAGRKRMRKDRTKGYRENIALKEEVKKWKQMAEKYKKRLQRHNKKSSSSDKKYKLLSRAIHKQYDKTRITKDKRQIQQIFEEKSIEKSRVKGQIIRDCLGIKQGNVRYSTSLPIKKLLKQKIENFFTRDDVSRATAGKRETVTYHKKKMQKRFLLDTMKNLHATFLKENDGIRCHYSYFVKNRPFYVKPPTVDGRDTCLCKLHANTAYIINALYKIKVIPTNNMSRIIEETVCSTISAACMTGTCKECSKKKLKYYVTNKEETVELAQWIRQTEIINKTGKPVKISKNVKVVDRITIEGLINKFESELKNIKNHVHKIKMQYKSYRNCIDGLTESEICIHIDFSENYACKYHEEIQSHHFGGSRNQVTLHTGVMYQGPSATEKITSFCSVSPNHNHGPAGIWAHLHPVLLHIRTNFPDVTTIHFFSDSPATQYRQKTNFYLTSIRTFEYGFKRVTWNFFEAGHGKGAADGVGGFLKRSADKIVATGKDISDATQFFLALKDISKIKLFFITDNDIQNITDTIPKEIVPLQGTMLVHQVFSESRGMLKHRKLSCFCSRGFCSCQNPMTHQPIPTNSQPNHAAGPSADIPSNNGSLNDLTNTICAPRQRFYDYVYSPNSSSEDDQPINTNKRSSPKELEASTSIHHTDLIEKENIHPSKITNGVYVLVKVFNENKSTYTYLGVANGEVDDEGDVKITFLKSVDDSGKRYKLVKTDMSYVTYDNLIKIVPSPKIILKGKRVLYEFDEPLETFEK